MRIAYKILLSIAAAFALMIVISNIGAMVLSMVISGTDFILVTWYAIAVNTGSVDSSTENFLFNFLTGFVYGIFGDMDPQSLIILLYLIWILELIGTLSAITGLLLPLTIVFIGGLISLICALQGKKNPSPGIFVFNAVIGGIICYFYNAVLGALMLAGSIIGNISAKRLKAAIEEEEVNKNAQQPVGELKLIEAK